MYAEIQTGTLTVVTAGCREETVSLLNEKRGKKGEKQWKDHIYNSTSLD